MTWTKIDFGKHEGKTLPHVAVIQPSYIRWGLECGAFHARLAAEAKEVLFRLQHIRIPRCEGVQWLVEAVWDHRGKFERLTLTTEATKYQGRHRSLTWKRLNLLTPWASGFERRGVQAAAVALFRRVYGGGRWSPGKAERFFSDDANFRLPADHEPAPEAYDDERAARMRGRRK